MNRKDFLSKSFSFGLGTLLLPSIFHSCNSDESLFEDFEYGGRVLVIGAGVAGLYAGYLLKEYGVNFTILEASDRAGGRMGRQDGFADFPIDTGAQWLHSDFSILGDLVKKSRTPVFFDNSETLYWHEGTLKENLPDNLQAIIDRIEEEPSDISFEEYFYQAGGTPAERSIITAVAGDSGASPDKISVKWDAEGYNLISYGDDDYKFEETYWDLIDQQILSPVADAIQLNTVVSRIDYAGDTVVVTDSNGQTYEADKVILTVPITVLQDNDIEFSPALPAVKTEAFGQVGMEAGMKAFMRFSQKFTTSNVLGGEVCAAYNREDYNRSSDDLVLMGFAMGDQGKALSDMGEAAALQAMLGELDLMFDGQASASYVSHYFVDWYTHPFVRGAYSYPLVGANENTRQNIAAPVDDKLFFAGEATNYNGHHQTVHGAVESAYREVIHILNSVQ